MKLLSFMAGAIITLYFVIALSCKSDSNGSSNAFEKIAENLTGWECTKGNGNVITKELSGLKDFDEVSMGISADVELTQGETFSVTFVGEDNLLDVMEIKVVNGDLEIGNKKGKGTCPTKDLKILVTMPSIKSVNLGGSGNIYATNAFKCDRLELNIGGSGNIKMQGSADKIEANIGGSGDIELFNLKAQKGEVNIGGSGNCDVNVEKSLEVNVAGSGDVRVKGNPSIDKNIIGSGEVKRMNEE
jgi:hypothetical protein